MVKIIPFLVIVILSFVLAHRFLLPLFVKNYGQARKNVVKSAKDIKKVNERYKE